jgi:hypothetical protein
VKGASALRSLKACRVRAQIWVYTLWRSWVPLVAMGGQAKACIKSDLDSTDTKASVRELP